MTSLSKLFDIYSLRARVYPGLLVLLPATVTAYLFLDLENLAKIWPLFISGGGAFFLATFVRGRGLSAEARLVLEWDGMPTTRALRHRSASNSVLRERRRARLEAVCDLVLPTLEEERTDPMAADDRYIAATWILVTRVRGKSDAFPRIQEENTTYGFRRNLYGMKSIAIVVLAVCGVASGLVWRQQGISQGLAVCWSVYFLALLAWIVVVTPAWVYQIGERYAERLFDALEDPGVVGQPNP